MLLDPTFLLVATVAALEMGWVWYQVNKRGPQRTRALVREILDERLTAQPSSLLKGGVDPRAAVQSREEKREAALAEAYGWLVRKVGLERAPLIWGAVPGDLKRSASGVVAIMRVLEGLVAAPAVTVAPKQMNPYMEP